MATHSLIGWIKTIILGLIAAAAVQSALIEICEILSATSAAKGLASVPTLAAFVSIVLWSLGPKWAKHVNAALGSAAAFFAVGLISSRVGLPYGAPGIIGAALVIWATSGRKRPSPRDSLPAGVTNNPRPRVIEHEGEVKQTILRISEMPYSSTLTEVGRSLLRELRSQSEKGNLALVLYRCGQGRPTATVGSYQPLKLERIETDRSVPWESCLTSFGLDIQSLAPYGLPARVALPDGPEVDIPANLAHGRWIVACSDPSSVAAKAIAGSLYRSGWRVESPYLGCTERIRQLFGRRRSPRATVTTEQSDTSGHDLAVQLCSSASALEGGDAVGVILPPFLANREQFLPKNLAFSTSSPRPLMVVGRGSVMEWGEDGWK